jgi:hypothetical protein
LQVTFEFHPQYLKATVRKRESVEDSKTAAAAIFEHLETRGLTRLLVAAEESDPIFRVELYGLGEWLQRLSALAVEKIALVSDSTELYASHQYIELIAGQRGVALKAFRSQSEALGWLLAA